MVKYNSETSRISIKFIDADTEEELFEIPNRNWTNMGEIFTDTYSSDIITRELKNKKLPNKILILAVKELILSK